LGRACSIHGHENAYKILVGKPQLKRPLGKSRHRWKYVEADLKITGKGVAWIHRAQDMD
jgi:hypothetical protein